MRNQKIGEQDAEHLALRRRSFTLWRQKFIIPAPPLALLQIMIGIASVVAIVGALQALLPHGVAWASIATAYVAADLSATLSTIPGGWGVLESVVLWLLPGVDPIGALIAFRVVYYIAPLALAGVLLASFEASQRRPRVRRVTFSPTQLQTQVAVAVQVPGPEPRT